MAQRHRYVLSRKIQNDLISKHNGYKGGDLAIPTIPNTITKQETEKPAPLTSLPANITDWMNMSNNDFSRLTPSDIDKLSNASFEVAFGKTRRLGNLLFHRIYDNNPDHQLISKAIDNRNDNIRKSKVSGGDLVPATDPAPATSTLPETAQDWKNMTDDELLKITPDDIINNLSDASFQIAFRETSTANPPGTFAIAQAIKQRLLNNVNGKENPNQAALREAIQKRWDNMSWWIPEDDPLWNTTLEGVPKWWLKHYNNYSWVKSQVVMYHAYQDFEDTTFYNKFKARIMTIKPPKKFARYMKGSIPGQERTGLGAADSSTYLHNIFEKYGQKWRVIFIQGDLSGVLSKGNDYYAYYIDSTGLDDYLDMLEEFYNDRDTLQPNEIVIMLNLQYREAVKKHERELLQQGFDQGVASEKAQEEAAKEASEDNSSSIWGTIGSVAMDVLPFLL